MLDQATLSDAQTTSQHDASALLPERDTGHPITLALIFRTLYRGRRTIQLVTLTAFVLAAVVAYLLPKTYTSTATFIPPGVNSGSGIAAMMGQISLGGASSLLGGKSQGDLYLGVLKSRSVQGLMVNWFHLRDAYKAKTEAQAEATLLKNSTFESGIKDSIITITVDDRNPVMARDLAEGYLKALKETNVRLALTESSQRRAFFEDRLQQEKEALADAEVRFQQSQKQTGLISPAGQTATQIQTLANLKAQVTSRQVQLAALLQSETEDNPEVTGLRREIQALEAQQGKLESGDKQKEFGSFSASQVPALQMEYIRAARDVKYHETLFEIIAKQYEAARLDEAKEAPIQILDHADLPDGPSAPRRKIIIALSTMAGAMIGIAFVLSREVFRPWSEVQ